MMAHVWAVRWTIWRFYRLPFAASLASAVSYITGYLIADCNHALAFSRSGALATAICVLCALWNYTQAISASEKQALKTFTKLIDEMKITVTRSQAIDRLSRKLAGISDRTVKVITIWNGLLLALATLVWGFGDLIFPGFCPP
jgi:CDP-diglyceride synthetase